MKKIIAMIALIAIGFTTQTFAQTEAEQKAWMDYMTPGDVHKMLAKYVGDWNEEITMWMDPKAAPMKMTTTGKTEMIMGGRYQKATSTGDMMGQPFEGTAITGYDNIKKVFTMIWLDNMGTGTTVSEGTWDAATKSITFKGKMMDPMSGKEFPFREVLTIIDDNTQKIEMYDTKTGKEFKNMEILMTRKK